MADLPPQAATPSGCPRHAAPRRCRRWRLVVLAGACSAAFAAPPPGPEAADGTPPPAVAQVVHALPVPQLQGSAAAAAPVLGPALAPAVRRWGLRALALGVGAGLGWGLMRLGDGGARARRTGRRDDPPPP